MDSERAKDTPDPATIVAVAVGRLGNPPRTTHAGLVYRDRDGKLAALHLGWHELLLTDPFDRPYVFAYPGIDPVRARNVACLCRLIRNQRPKIPYSFHLDLNARFCTRTGDVLTLGEGHGLTLRRRGSRIGRRGHSERMGRRGDAMTPRLTDGGYAQTKAKLENLERRLADLESRADPKPLHLAAVRRSYQSMIRQYQREIKLYESERGQESQET